MRKQVWMCSGVFACILATVAASSPRIPQNFASDAALAEDSNPLPSAGLCGRSAVEKAPAGIVAIVVIPGPMNSTRIAYEIWNYGSDSISAVNIDGFDALGSQGLLFRKVTVAQASHVGAVRVEYPQSGIDGKGAIVLGFDGFEPEQCAAIVTEAGTWGDTTFRGRVMDAVGVHVQVVFEHGQRGNGEMFLCGSNGRFARDVACRPGDAVALISGSRTAQVRLSQ